MPDERHSGWVRNKTGGLQLVPMLSKGSVQSSLFRTGSKAVGSKVKTYAGKGVCVQRRV